MLQVHEAQEEMLAAVLPTAKTKLSLTSAMGKTIATPHLTKRILPPWDNSAMDGFALRFEDVAEASLTQSIKLKVVSEAACGDQLQTLQALNIGEACRIMTGAPVPPGANAVVIKEKVVVHQESNTFWIEVTEPVSCHANIRFMGEDVAANAMVADAGVGVTPARLSLLASSGYSEVEVHQAPKIAIIASGSELVPMGQKPQPHQIVNSNAHAVGAVLQSAGAEVQILGIAPDTLKAHAKLLNEAAEADLVVTIGGVSMGEKDWVRPALESIGAKQVFWKVAMRPGKPLVFAKREQQLFVGLPGNPVSALVGAELFLLPMIRKFMGQRNIFTQPFYATLGNKTPLKKRADFMTFFRAHLSIRQERFEVIALTKQSSGQISGLAESNALLVTPVGPNIIHPGAVLQVLPLSSTILQPTTSLSPS